MPADRESLRGVYRFTSIARPVDPAYPTNRALLLALPMLVVASAALATADVIALSPAAAAINALLVGFVSWALTRELAPDDDAAAFLALFIAWPVSLFLGPSSVLLGFAVLFLVRIVNQSTGLSARPFDTVSVLGLSVFAAYSMDLPLLLIVAGLAFIADALLPNGAKLHYVAAGVCAGAFSWLGIDSIVSTDQSYELWAGFAAITIACSLVMANTRHPVSVCDVRPDKLIAVRVNAGLGIGLLAGVQFLLTAGASAWATTPLFACLVAVPLSFGMQRLLSLGGRRT
ncbi:MAG: hypothetical protein QNJ05_03630 [Woeseiaceae bacterium]|nr:hypothetical protein [Woeseiaceae bacterium]